MRPQGCDGLGQFFEVCAANVVSYVAFIHANLLISLSGFFYLNGEFSTFDVWILSN